MNLFIKFSMGFLICFNFPHNAYSQPIYHEKFYPNGPGPFPAVMALHTSGGFKTIKHLIQRYVDNGFSVYAPDFFIKHQLTLKNRMETFSTYRESIEHELSEIVSLMKNDTKLDKNNIFAVGFSNGGFWVCYLAGSNQINAGVSHYGVWKANYGPVMTNPYPMKYFSKNSAPMLALHGEDDGTQKIKFAKESWAEIKERGAKLETHIYSNTGHVWDNKSSTIWKYDQNVEKDSHKKTIEFFKIHMK